MPLLSKIKLAHLTDATKFRSSFLRSARVRSISTTTEAVEDRNGAAYGAGWDAGGAAVKIGVWWDFENCNVPYGIDAHRVGLNIVSGLRSSGFQGPVSISGYGDMLQLSRAAQESLSSTGIRLHHVPSGGKESESSDRALLMDLILWTIENPPPAHLFLISGDRDFSTALHKLRMRNYNVLLACPAGAYISPALLGAASRVWYWNSLARGEALVAATSWSIEGPPPKPILPPLSKAPPPPSSSHLSSTSSSHSSSTSSTSSGNQQQHKIPYFSTPTFSCPPVPPPFSCSSSSSSSTDSPIKLPPLPSETSNPAPGLSPYSVSSPNFPSVSSAPISPPAASPPQSEAQVQAATTKSTEANPSRLNSAVKIAPPETKMPESNPKANGIAEVLFRLDALLKAHPKGLWLWDLQTQMHLKKIQFDSEFYGHKKLVPYLLTLPRIARVERHLMKDNKTWSYMFFPSTARASEMSSSKRADYPVEVLSQLSDLFRQHPKGIWLTELNAELVARSIRLETNFYGHGKIVPFLLSLPEMVKIERRYIGDRWSYIFFWNQDGIRKLELTTLDYKKPLPIKKGVVITLRKSENSSSVVVKAATNGEVATKEDKESLLTKEPIAQSTEADVGEKIEVDVPEKVEKPFHEGIPLVDGSEHFVKKECALMIVEEQVPTLPSRLAASVFGFVRRICRRLWLKGRNETLCIEKGNVVTVAAESTSLEKPVQEQMASLSRHHSIRRNRRRIKAVKSRTAKSQQDLSERIGATSSEVYLREIEETKLEGAMQASALEAQTIQDTQTATETHENAEQTKQCDGLSTGLGQEVFNLEPVIEYGTAVPISIEPMEEPPLVNEDIEVGSPRQEQDISTNPNVSPSMKDKIDVPSTPQALGGENTREELSEGKTEIRTEPVEIERTVDLKPETLQHVFVSEEQKSPETSEKDAFLKKHGRSLKQDAGDATGDKEGVSMDFISEQNDFSLQKRKDQKVKGISVDQKIPTDGVLKLLQSLSEKREQIYVDKPGHRGKIITNHSEAILFSSSSVVEQNSNSAAAEEVIKSGSVDGTHDIDRVLKLFQSFGGEARESDQTPPDDHGSQWHPSVDATKVLDLLEKSTRRDPDQAPDFEGHEQTKDWIHIGCSTLDTHDTVPKAAERSLDTPSKPKRQSRKKDANSDAGNNMIGEQELLLSTSSESQINVDSFKTQTPAKRTRTTKTKRVPIDTPKNTESTCETAEKAASVKEVVMPASLPKKSSKGQRASQSVVDNPKSEAVEVGEKHSNQKEKKEKKEKKENVTAEPSKRSYKKRLEAKDKTITDVTQPAVET